MTSKIKDINVSDWEYGQKIHVEFDNGWNEWVYIRSGRDRFYLAAALRTLASAIEAHEEVDG